MNTKAQDLAKRLRDFRDTYRGIDELGFSDLLEEAAHAMHTMDDYATEINRLRNVIQAACTGGTDYMIERWKALFPDEPVPSVKPTRDAADAARYRWLRDTSVPPHNFYLSVPDEFHGVRYAPGEVDDYIDKARGA